MRIVNQLNDNYDYFYVKRADASRVYGLELEHLLSPNSINYLRSRRHAHRGAHCGHSRRRLYPRPAARPHLNQVRIAKEFVKFNERCFARLLGDMRAYNYVIDVTPDFEDEQYRVRAIDFDQQCYEGKKNMYLPQFFKDNRAVVQLCGRLLKPETIRQYQTEERTLMARRARSERHRLKDLIDCLRRDEVSPPREGGAAQAGAQPPPRHQAVQPLPRHGRRRAPQPEDHAAVAQESAGRVSGRSVVSTVSCQSGKNAMQSGKHLAC